MGRNEAVTLLFIAMRLSIDLPDNQLDRLREEAERLGIPPEELARAVVAELLGHPREDFRSAAGYVLEKNRELYQRLS